MMYPPDVLLTAFLSLLVIGLSGTSLFVIFGGLFYLAARKVERDTAETPVYPSLRAFYVANTWYYAILLAVCFAAFCVYSCAQ